MRFSYVDWIAMVVNPFFSFDSALEKKKKSRKWVDSFPFRNTYTGFYCHSNGHSMFRFHFLFSTNFTQLSQTFNLSLWMAISSARVFFPSCDCRTRFFTIQFSMHGQHFVHKLRWIVHSVWTTVGNVLIIFPMLFFFLFHFHSIISDEIYIYNSKTCFRLLYKWKCFRKKAKDKFRLIVCMCMKNH